VKKPKYDVIGYWSEVKLDIVRRYATEYSKILNSKKRHIRKHIYVDAFAGAGQHISRRTGEFIAGSPLNALLVEPPFSEIHLIDLDGTRADQLRDAIGSRNEVFVYQGDANQVLLEQVFPRCRYEEFHRALCLLDPYALSVDWKVIHTAGKMRSVEIFYNFMIMDANMNILWRNPDKVPEDQLTRMDKVWGDRSWRRAAYKTGPGLFGEIEEKADNQAIAEAFRMRLKKMAGFKYVPEPMPMRNEKGAVVYYLFFASQNETGANIVEYIFEKYRKRGLR
jgi:three-Cys-motif partner protein